MVYVLMKKRRRAINSRGVTGMVRHTVLVIIVLLFTTFFGCNRQLDFRLVIAPTNIEMRTSQAILVLGFGSGTTSNIRSSLLAGRLHSVVEESSAADATIILEGSLKPEYVTDVRTDIVEVPKRCIKRGKAKKGRKGRPCIRWQSASTYKRYTLTEKCDAVLKVKLTRVSDGAFLSETRFKGTNVIENSEKHKVPPQQGGKSVCKKATGKTLDKLAKWLSPHLKRVSFRFKNSGSKAMQTPIRRLKAGDLNGAIVAFEQAIVDPQLAPKERAWLRYNFALAFEVQENWSLCVEQSELAAQVVDDDQIWELIRRCQQQLY